jgi:hypothetical protein
MSDLKLLSKDELEALGREYGIELDRRLLKSKMVNQLQEHIDSLPSDETPEPIVESSLSDDLSELGSLDNDKLLSLAKDYGIDTSVIGTKGKLISSLIEKL